MDSESREMPNRDISEIAVSLLGVYMAASEIILEGSQNNSPGEQAYPKIRKLRDNYKEYLNIFRESIREQELKAHEKTIQRKHFSKPHAG